MEADAVGAHVAGEHLGTMERMRHAWMPLQGSEESCETWAVLPAKLHHRGKELNHVYQKGGFAGSAPTHQALPTVQNAVSRSCACLCGAGTQNRLRKEFIMKLLDEFMVLFEKKGV